jgi:hypothetical protein
LTFSWHGSFAASKRGVGIGSSGEYRIGPKQRVERWGPAPNLLTRSRICWGAEITYSYVIDGEYYSGFEHLPAEDQKHAEGLALGWKDREIVVRYSLGEPTKSALLLEDQKQILTAISNG